MEGAVEGATVGLGTGLRGLWTGYVEEAEEGAVEGLGRAVGHLQVPRGSNHKRS